MVEEYALSVCGYKVFINKQIGKGIILPFVEAEKDGTKFLAHCVKLTELTKKQCEFINNETEYHKRFEFFNIIKRVEAPKSNGTYLLILYQYCNMGSIANYYKTHTMTVDELKEIAHQLIKVLFVFNLQQLAVLVLSPESIFLNNEKGQIRVIVGDLMLIHKFKDQMIKFNNYTYLYKNFWRKEIDSQTDIHALGTLLTILGKDVDLGDEAMNFNELLQICFAELEEEKDIKEIGELMFHNFLKRPGKFNKEYDSKGKKNVGKGGFGIVFSAKRKNDIELEVAVKLQELDLTKAYNISNPQRLVAIEVKSLYGMQLTELGRKYCVKLFDHFIDEDGFYMIMEYCPQGNLRNQLNKNLKLEVIAKIAKEIALGLEALHEFRLIHRDLKPENVIFTDFPNSTAKLCDFGIAKQLMSSGNEEISIMIKSKNHLPPEALQEMQNINFDIWCYGRILYEMNCGCPPEINVNDVYESKIVFKKKIDKRMQKLICLCLAKKAHNRISSRKIVEYLEKEFHV